MIVNQHKPLTALALLTHAMKLERSVSESDSWACKLVKSKEHGCVN